MQIILYCMTIIINLKGKLYRTYLGYLSESPNSSPKDPLDDHVHTLGNLQLIKIMPSKHCIHSDDDYQIVLPQFSLRGVHSLPSAHASFSNIPSNGMDFFLFELASFASGSLESLTMLE